MALLPDDQAHLLETDLHRQDFEKRPIQEDDSHWTETGLPEAQPPQQTRDSSPRRMLLTTALCLMALAGLSSSVGSKILGTGPCHMRVAGRDENALAQGDVTSAALTDVVWSPVQKNEDIASGDVSHSNMGARMVKRKASNATTSMLVPTDTSGSAHTMARVVTPTTPTASASSSLPSVSQPTTIHNKVWSAASATSTSGSASTTPQSSSTSGPALPTAPTSISPSERAESSASSQGTLTTATASDAPITSVESIVFVTSVISNTSIVLITSVVTTTLFISPPSSENPTTIEPVTATQEENITGDATQTSVMTVVFTNTDARGSVVLVTSTHTANPVPKATASTTRPPAELQTNSAAHCGHNRILEAVVGAVIGGALMFY